MKIDYVRAGLIRLRIVETSQVVGRRYALRVVREHL